MLDTLKGQGGDTFFRNIFFKEENIIILTYVIGIKLIHASNITYDAVQNNIIGNFPSKQTLAPPRRSVIKKNYYRERERKKVHC